MFSQVDVITKISKMMIFKFFELMEYFHIFYINVLFYDFHSMLLQELMKNSWKKRKLTEKLQK